jgi:copper transport protein
MAPTRPPQVQRRPDVAQTVFEWQVPFGMAGQDLAVQGVLRWIPPGAAWPWLVGAAAVAALPGLVLLLMGRGRPRVRASASEPAGGDLLQGVLRSSIIATAVVAVGCVVVAAGDVLVTPASVGADAWAVAQMLLPAVLSVALAASLWRDDPAGAESRSAGFTADRDRDPGDRLWRDSLDGVAVVADRQRVAAVGRPCGDRGEPDGGCAPLAHDARQRPHAAACDAGAGFDGGLVSGRARGLTRGRGRTSASRRAGILIACVALALLGTAGPASAHAALRGAVPGDGQVLDAAPRDVRLEFNEPVALTPDGLRVHDATGARVPLGPVDQRTPEVVQAPFLGRIPDGSYIVTWRVASADGHPVAGALVFSVGDPVQVDAALIRQVFASGTVQPAAVAASVVRWIGYLCVLLVAGGVLFLVWAADPRDRAALELIVRRAAAAGVVAAVIAVAVQAAEVSGAGLGVLARGDLLIAAITSSVGVQSGLQVLALIAVVVALRRGAPHLALPAAAIAVVALIIAGHTRTVQPQWLVVATDALHTLAAATWLGGLVLLWPAVRRRHAAEDPVGAAGTIARFSSLATVAVIGVSVAGTVMGWTMVRTVTALTSTAYGRLLIAKVALATVVIAVGAYNNRRLVPAMVGASPSPSDPRPPARWRRRSPSPGSQPAAHAGGSVAIAESPLRAGTQAPAWARLRQTVRGEVVLLTAVVAVTAVLVGAQPAAEAAGVGGPFSTAVPVGEDAQLSLTIDPSQVGANSIHLYLLDNAGRPVDASELELQLSLPANDIGPIVRSPTFIAPGHWVHTGRELAVAGQWQVDAVVTIGRFEQRRATATVDVRP